LDKSKTSDTKWLYKAKR